MNFFEFCLILEAQSFQGIIYWDKNRWTTENHSKEDIRAFIDKNRISIDFASPQHPNIKKSLSILMRQYPSLKNHIVIFDGNAVGTLKEYIHNYKERPLEIPKFLYHGTSESAWDEIQRDGLLPRNETGVSASFGANLSHVPKAKDDLIYLATFPNDHIKFAAREASKGDMPVLLQIDSKGLDRSNFFPDEDTDKNTWKASMHLIGSIAYRGAISPENISLFKVLKNNKWIDPEEEKPDWIKKHFDDIKSTGLGKWFKPKD